MYRAADRTPGFEQTIWYGCEYHTGELRRLDRDRDFAHLRNLALAGRYVAYSAWEEEPAGSEIVEQVHLDDLRTGARVTMEAFSGRAGREPGVNERVRSLVLKPSSSLAWIATRSGPDFAALHQVSAVGPPPDGLRTRLDQGRAISPRSLALSQDRRRVYWTKAGEPHSARLP